MGRISVARSLLLLISAFIFFNPAAAAEAEEVPYRIWAFQLDHPSAVKYSLQDEFDKALSLAVDPSNRIEITYGAVIHSDKWLDKDRFDFTVSNRCDALLYGKWYFTGKTNDRKVLLDLDLWALPDGKGVYHTRTVFPVAELSNRIADLTRDIMKTALRMEMKKKRKLAEENTAYLNFINYKIGSEKYDIYLDDELVDSPANNNFGLKLPVIPGKEYTLVVKKQDDKKEVVRSKFVLEPKETRVIDYTATGTVVVRPVENGEMGRRYSFFIDRYPAEANVSYTNFWAGLNYELKVMDERSNAVYTEKFYLKDKELRELRPALKAVTGLHARVYTSDDTYVGLGLDFLFNRYFWIGAGMGLTSVLDLSAVKNIFIFLPYAQAGFYFLGDRSHSFHAGGGIVYQGMFFTPDTQMKTPNQFSGIGLFLSAEFLIFYLQPAFYYDFSQFRFQISAGVKF